MSAQGTTIRERGSTDEPDTLVTRARTLLGSGIGAVIAGVVLVVGALRSTGARSKLQAFAGIALVALGVRRLRSDETNGFSEDELDQEVDIESDDDDGGAVSDEARANVEQHAVSAEEGENPRDVSNDPAADTAEDEGDIQFTRDQDDGLREEPELDDADSTDPRQDSELDDDDAQVEVDISEAAMAEEPGEAAGPTSTQAQPTTKDTSTTPEADAEADSRDDTTDDRDEQDDRETAETSGEATVHTDTVESGSTDIDVDDVTDPNDDMNQEPEGSADQTSSRLENGEDEDEETDDGDEATEADDGDDTVEADDGDEDGVGR